MLFDRNALENHSYVATKAERIRNSTHWIPTLNQEGAQQPLNQRPDFAQAKRECKRLHDEHLARTQEEYRTIPRNQQTRSEKDKRLRELKNITMQSTRKQVGGSTEGRGETCRQLRPRQQIGIESIGRRTVGMHSSWSDDSLKKKSQSWDQFRLTGENFPDYRRECEKNTPSNNMYRCAQCVTHTEQNDHISSHEHASRVAQDCTSFVSQNSCHPRVMFRSMPHLTLTTSASSLSPTSPVFPRISPSHPRTSVHDEYSPCEDPRQSGRRKKSSFFRRFHSKMNRRSSTFSLQGSSAERTNTSEYRMSTSFEAFDHKFGDFIPFSFRF